MKERKSKRQRGLLTAQTEPEMGFQRQRQLKLTSKYKKNKEFLLIS